MSEVLHGNAGGDQLNISADKTQVYGLAGDDTLISDKKSDALLVGGSGDDSLIMLGGNGTLAGGDGADIFELNYSATEKISAVIEDLNPTEDKIVVNFDGNTAPQLSSVASGDDVVWKDSDGNFNLTLKSVRENDYFDGTASVEAWQVLKLTNAEREAQNLSPLTMSDGLTAGASIRAQEITARGINGLLTDHTRYPASLGGFSTVFDDVGKHYSHFAENLDGGATSPEQVVYEWMNSDAHKTNILNATYKKIGVGYNYDDSDKSNLRWYWTQLFGDSLVASELETVSAAYLLTANIEIATVQKAITLTNSPDTYSNSEYGATIQALGGSDSITNSGFNVSISGGADNDTLQNSGSFVTVDGGAGNDLIQLGMRN